METFSALLDICAGNSLVPSEFPAQRPAARSFDVFFDLRLNKRLSKHSWGWWFVTLSCQLWRHCNDCHSRHIFNGFTIPRKSISSDRKVKHNQNQESRDRHRTSSGSCLREKSHDRTTKIIIFTSVPMRYPESNCRNNFAILIIVACNRLAPLTHCGLVTPHGDIDLCQHWLR